jgi:drug/metabolite transporter (DMT)-like permease
MLSIGILAGLVAMLCWGIADFLQALVIKKIGSSKTMLIGNVITLLFTLPFFMIFILRGYFSFSAAVLVTIVVSSIIDAVAVFAFMRSYDVGEVSVVTPISASYSLVTVILAMLFLGERLPAMKLVSVIVIIAGIILTSTDIKKFRLHAAAGVKESVVALFGWGIYFLLIGIAMKQQAHAFPDQSIWVVAGTIFFLSTMFNSIFLAGIGLVSKGIPTPSELKHNITVIFINFLLYTLAWVAVNYGIAQELVSIVAPVSSLYPALTVLLAMIILKEKLAVNQKYGIVLTLLGIFLISL